MSRLKVFSSAALVLLLAVPVVNAQPRGARMRAESRAYNDATRLAAILHDVRSSRANVSPQAWRVTANEANVLADRLYNETRGKSHMQARDARVHVRQFRQAAMRGDGVGAQSHANQALPFVWAVVEAYAPPRR